MAIDELMFSGLGANDLVGFQNQVQSRDPFNIASQVLAQWQPNYSYMDAGESGMTAFGKAFLSGLAGNFAQNRAADQMSSIVNILPDLQKDPMSVVAPEGVDLSAFQMLRGNAALRKFQRDALVADQNRNNVSDLLKTILGKVAETDPEGALAAAVMPQDQLAKQISKIVGKSDPLKNPNSPAYKANQDLKVEEDKFRAEINKIPSVLQFQNMQKGLPLVAGFKDQDSKSSDVGFVYNFIKSLDDGAVRGEEINMAQASNPLVLQYKNILEGAFTGQSTLTPALKNKMYNELLSAQGGIYTQALKDSKIVSEIAKNRGITNNIFPFDTNLTFGGGSQVAAGFVPQSEQQRIIAYVKMVHRDKPEAEQKRIAAEALEQAKKPTSPGGIPLG